LIKCVKWKYDEEKKNGDTGNGLNYAFSNGLSIITSKGKNRLHEKKDLNFAGHTANGYDLFGGLFFDRAKGYGVILRGNGVSKYLKEFVEVYSFFNRWALKFIKLADEVALFDYPLHVNEVKTQKTNYLFYIIFTIIILVIILIGLLALRCIKRREMFGGAAPLLNFD